ncbi:helix-turn-helix transcriptional regulator [Polymorphospora sp. NPDC051019]|uniref:PadR family transcriptional regulator n=1 Tax=Polymorphospora sp. NPDC051019 TaxID=3155725 RepID=UPI00343E1A01
MPNQFRVTKPFVAVLEQLLIALKDDVELHGYAISQATDQLTPTVYGNLDKLEDANWVTSRWETQEPGVNRPRRRLYRLTPTGATEARAILTERERAAARKVRRPTLPARLAGPLVGEAL